LLGKVQHVGRGSQGTLLGQLDECGHLIG
jgi:hypothetical protein